MQTLYTFGGGAGGGGAGGVGGGGVGGGGGGGAGQALNSGSAKASISTKPIPITAFSNPFFFTLKPP